MIGYSRLLHSITLQNLLSYGPDSAPLDLRALNVLIGPNASGKSNLVEALDLLRAAPKDLAGFIREGGGVGEWLWKGTPKVPTATIDVVVAYPAGQDALRHRLAFTASGPRLEVTDEAVEDAAASQLPSAQDDFYYRYRQGRPQLRTRRLAERSNQHAGALQEAGQDYWFVRELRREDLAPDQSVLSQRRDPDQYPELAYLGDHYTQFRLYREWNLGRVTPLRLPQKPDLPTDFLLEDASNLGLVLNDLEHRAGMRSLLLEKLREFYAPVTDISTKIASGTVQVFLHERGLREPVPATRLSDGTLRYLCLLAILCHPAPPPLIAIEEPELGLHPDILPTIANLLVEASQRTQLVVTTHADGLVDSLTATPDAVIVCEKKRGYDDHAAAGDR